MRRSVLAVLSLWVAWAVSVSVSSAQFYSDDPLVVAFLPIPPFAQFAPDGSRSGFLIELAEEIGSEIGVPIEYLDLRTSEEFIAAQVAGQTDMIAGVARLPVLEESSVFSAPVASDQLRLTVLSERADAFAEGDVVDLRLGIVPPALGAEERDLLSRNETVTFETPEAAVMGLLIGNADALLIPEPATFSIARRAGADGRIRFVGAPIRTVDRVVALHESRADLLAPVNAAIGRMRADGRLADLAARYHISVPPPPPDVLSVGVYHFPPYQIVGEDGSISGFSIETLRGLADIAGLELRFEVLDAVSEWQAGPGAGRYDLLPQVGIIADRRDRMDFTLPVEQSPHSIFMRAGEAGGVTGLDDLAGLRVGVLPANVAYQLVQDRTDFELVQAEDTADLMAALLERRADAILFPRARIIEMAEATGTLDEIDVVNPPFYTSEFAVGLRFGLGEVREKLNAVIPGYLISGEYQRLREAYFGDPAFWTPPRIRVMLAVVVAILLATMGVLMALRQRERDQAYSTQQRELEQELAHGEALGSLVTELERSNRELDEFAYTASHDLREPLRGIAINANFLSRENLSEKAQDRVDRMLVLTDRMEKLVADLLFFSRLGRGERVMKDVDPHHIIEGICKELFEWLSERRGEVRFATELPWIHAERSKVKSLFQNVITNGLKYNDSEVKTVEIGFSAKADVRGRKMRNVFWVRDNGIGINDKNHEKVFRIFQRLNLEEDYGAGTGAGLSFARKIAEEYGGEITFTSEMGRGSTFYFTLPLAENGDKPD